MNILISGTHSILTKELSHRLPKELIDCRIDYLSHSPIPPSSSNHYSALNLNSLKDNYQVVIIITAFIPPDKSIAHLPEIFKINTEFVSQLITRYPDAFFVFCSSVSIYGKPSSLPLTENSPSLEVESYGLSKLWAENLLKTTKSAIFRISSLYGKGMKANTFLPRIIAQAQKSRSIDLWGDGHRKQNYIHVSDVAGMMIMSIKKNISGTFLATDISSYSNSQVAEIVKHFLPDTKINYQGEDLSPSFEYNNQATLTQLGYTITTDLPKGIKELIQNEK